MVELKHNIDREWYLEGPRGRVYISEEEAMVLGADPSMYFYDAPSNPYPINLNVAAMFPSKKYLARIEAEKPRYKVYSSEGGRPTVQTIKGSWDGIGLW